MQHLPILKICSCPCQAGPNIPQGVKLFICRRQIPRLAGYANADFLHRFQKCLPVHRGVKTRNCLQLIHRTAGMSQTPAAHFRHRNTACRHQRRQNQRCFVTDSAGAVFIHLDTGDVGKIYLIARAGHRVGHPSNFLVGHPRKANRHQ